MGTFFDCWKKGWKVWLMMVCVNFAVVLMIIPLAILTAIFLQHNVDLYVSMVAIVAIIFAPALTYCVFRLFYAEEVEAKKVPLVVVIIAITLLLLSILLQIYSRNTGVCPWSSKGKTTSLSP